MIDSCLMKAMEIMFEVSADIRELFSKMIRYIKNIPSDFHIQNISSDVHVGMLLIDK